VHLVGFITRTVIDSRTKVGVAVIIVLLLIANYSTILYIYIVYVCMYVCMYVCV